MVRLAEQIAVSIIFLLSHAPAQVVRWPEAKADKWHEQQGWLVGSNFVPSSAINQLEMWQADTFDVQEIDKELGWAEDLGMNTMRVFLHDLLWYQDYPGFMNRVDRFLSIAAKHRIRPIFVLFDSCWDPAPKLGPQHPPIPGIHNSGWVQSPGAAALEDPSQRPRLRAYVEGIIGAFASDPRVLAWDLWNEPDNTNERSYGMQEPKNKIDLVEALLPQVFEWAREARSSQPLTSGVWHGNWSSDDKLSSIERIQLDESDVISFHNYSWPEDFQTRIEWLKRYRRPIVCTEYMARPVGSTFDAILPKARAYGIGVINWGFVAGKTQTYLPWDSWERPYVLTKPPVWFHDLFKGDGTPYREAEVKLISEMTRKHAAAPP